MPIVSSKETGFNQFLPPDDETVKKNGPGFTDIVSAAFEQENTLASFASNGFEIGHSFKPVKGYNVFDEDIEGYELYSDSFIESRSPEHTTALKMQVDREIDNQKILRDGGATSFIATVAAGLTDPVYWPLMLTGVGEARLAVTAGKAFATAAGTGALAEIPAEIIKSNLQETRTVDQSLINIGASAIFSGLLGVGLNKLRRGAPEVEIDEAQLSREMEAYVNGDEVNLSMGAAQTQTLTKEDLDLVGLAGLEKVPVSPLIRTMNSPEVRVQQITSTMMEAAPVTKGNKKGVKTAPEDGAVETRIKRWDYNVYQTLTGLNDFYAKYKGNNPGEHLSFGAFREQVSFASRRGDKSDIPEVAEMAAFGRKEAITPIKDAAITQSLLAHDIKPAFAESYLTRVYNQKKITARLPEWNQMVDGWINGIKASSQRKMDDLIASGKDVSDSIRATAGMQAHEVAEMRRSITDKISGVPSGRTAYDEVTLSGPLKDRTFAIPDTFEHNGIRFEDFLENDYENIIRQYVKTMAPDIELTKAFGEVDMKATISEVVNGYTIKMEAAPTEKARLKLKKQRDSDVIDISAMRDSLRGTYKMPDNPDAFLMRAGRVIRDFNFMRMLGQMTISALTDTARLVAVNGLKPVAKGLSQMAHSTHRFNLAREEGKKAAAGLDMIMNSRSSSLAELADAHQMGSTFERGVRKASDTFAKMTLMPYWNSAMKQFASIITMDRILIQSQKWANGTISKANITRLAHSGIDEDLAKRISAQFDKHGDDGIIKLPQGDKWDDLGALETFRSSTLKDVDRAIVTPGKGEKPNWSSTETGKMIFQFKSFAASAHHKVLLADLQFRDASALNGFLFSVGMGAMVYGIKQKLSGREISDNPNQIIIESMDKSGGFGYFWDLNNISSKMTNGIVSVENAVGGDPLSRFASRNIAGALLGPSLGTAEDIRQVTGNISSGDFSDKDIRRIRRMLPGQNIFYMRQLLNSIEEGIAK